MSPSASGTGPSCPSETQRHPVQRTRETLTSAQVDGSVYPVVLIGNGGNRGAEMSRSRHGAQSSTEWIHPFTEDWHSPVLRVPRYLPRWLPTWAPGSVNVSVRGCTVSTMLDWQENILFYFFLFLFSFSFRHPSSHSGPPSSRKSADPSHNNESERVRRDLSDVPLGDHVPPQAQWPGVEGPFFNSSGALASVHLGVRFSPLSEFPLERKRGGGQYVNLNRWEMVKLRSTDADWEKKKRSRSDPADTETPREKPRWTMVGGVGKSS